MCSEMQPAIVLLRPKETSAVLVVKGVGKWFAGLRPVLETLQQGCAHTVTWKHLLEKQRLSKSICSEAVVAPGNT